MPLIKQKRFSIAWLHIQDSELHQEIIEGESAQNALGKVPALKPYLDAYFEANPDGPESEDPMLDIKQFCMDGEMFVNWIEV